MNVKRIIPLLAGAPLLLVASALVHCSSSSDSNSPDAGSDAAPDVIHHPEAGGGDDGGDAAAACTMTGSLDITVNVKAFGLPAQPLAGALGRAENAAGDCAESMPAGADGVVHIKVDPAKGPFDITVGAEAPDSTGATVVYNAVSILGQTGPITGDVVLGPITSSATTVKTAGVGGTISNVPGVQTDGGTAGGDAGGPQIQIDGWDFQTVVTPATSTSYSTQYDYDANNLGANALPLPLAAILVDATGNAVSGVYTAATPRTGSAMGINIDFSQSPLTPTTSTINIQFPTAGVVTGSALTMIGNPAAGNSFIGNAIVVKTTPLEKGAEQFVGVGNVTLPDSTGKSVFTLQEFPAPMDPTIAEAALYGSTYIAIVQPHTLTAGSTVNVGQVDKLNATGTSLGDVTFDVASTGYDAVEAFVSTPVTSSGGGGVTLWAVYATGATLANHGLPHLPSGIPSSDLTGGAGLEAAAQVVKLATGAPAAWTATASDSETVAGMASGAMITSDGR